MTPKEVGAAIDLVAEVVPQVEATTKQQVGTHLEGIIINQPEVTTTVPFLEAPQAGAFIRLEVTTGPYLEAQAGAFSSLLTVDQWGRRLMEGFYKDIRHNWSWLD